MRPTRFPASTKTNYGRSAIISLRKLTDAFVRGTEFRESRHCRWRPKRPDLLH
jgi:hypothetical protein